MVQLNRVVLHDSGAARGSHQPDAPSHSAGGRLPSGGSGGAPLSGGTSGGATGRPGVGISPHPPRAMTTTEAQSAVTEPVVLALGVEHTRSAFSRQYWGGRLIQEPMLSIRANSR
jgi:hypothetical protein